MERTSQEQIEKIADRYIADTKRCYRASSRVRLGDRLKMAVGWLKGRFSIWARSGASGSR